MDNRAEPIYMDHGATTPISPAAREAIFENLELFGNPSSLYSLGRKAKNKIKESRQIIADAIGALPEEIYFTSGGSESNSWAIRGTAEERGLGHIITTAVEHPSVLNACESLERKGWSVTRLSVNQEGRVFARQVLEAVREDTILISVMAANNEVGTIMPVEEIGRAAGEKGILFHSDAVQAAGHIPLNAQEMGMDLCSLSGHKFGAPKGTGVLYIRKGVRIAPWIHGGGQEQGRRGGTENTLGIIAMAAALDSSVRQQRQAAKKLDELTKQLARGVLQIDGARRTSPENRLPGTISFVFEGVDGNQLIHRLDRKGLCVSGGSACSSGTGQVSHVLLAMGYEHSLAQSALRFSLSEHNTESQVKDAARLVTETVKEMREAYGYYL